MRYQLVLASLVVILAGCGSSGSSEPPVAIDVDGVNALVPAELKAKVVFERREIVLERGRRPTTYTVAAPVGWSQQMAGFGSLEPDRALDLGFFTDMTVGTDCDGMCQSKDWAAVADEKMAQLRDGRTIVREVKTANEHQLIATDPDGTEFVKRAWWRKGARQYRYCSATLGKPLAAAAPAFEKACMAVNAVSDD